MRRPVFCCAASLLFVGVLVAGCAPSASSSSGSTAAPGTTVAPVVRETLGQAPAPAAPGYDQYLLRVTIQPGVKLPTHHHPGLQIARIESGDLNYTIVSGTASIARNGGATATEQATGPAEVTLRKGDTVYENESLVHYGENKGSVPVVVVLAAVFKSGEGVSINN